MTEHRPLCVHIEGTDLCGKTSVANLFMSRDTRVWAKRHNSLSPAGSRLEAFADEMSESGLHSRLTLNFAYAACILADLDTYSPPAQHTVQESTSIIRSIGHAHAGGAREIESILRGELVRHPDFDYSFYLTASLEARIDRFNKRSYNSAHDRMILSDPDFFFTIEETARALSVERFGSRVIDTSSLTIEEIVAIIQGEVPS